MTIDLQHLFGKISGYNSGDQRNAENAIINEIKRLESIENDVGFHKSLIQERNKRIAQLELDLEIANAKTGEFNNALWDLQTAAHDLRFAVQYIKDREEGTEIG